MQLEKFSLKKRIKSFKYAYNGIAVLFKEEHNARIHAVATLLVVIAGFIFHLSCFEWVAIVFAIGIVLSAEAVNSALERTADFVKAERDDRKRDIKDLGAAAVFICAITAAIIGCLIFIPKIIALCSVN